MNFLETVLSNIFNVDDIFELIIKFLFALGIYLAFKLSGIIITKILPKLIHIFARLHDDELEKSLAKSLSRPFSMYLGFIGIFLAIQSLPFTNDLNLFITGISSKVIRTATIILISVILQNIVGNTTLFFKRANEAITVKYQTTIKFFVNVSKAVIIALTGFILISEFGYDISGLITGLGLSGVVFALAAQDTASNFFSGLVILADRPFEIGDWIAIGSMEGVVEEINFRSSRIRTFDNALIAVPNSKLSSESVINWSKMSMRKTKIHINLLYSTRKETLQKICKEIYDNLQTFSEVNHDSIIVRFDKFNDSSLDVLIQYNSYPIPLAEHVALKEKVQFMIMDVIHNNDSDFAYPTQTIYTANM